MRSRGPYSGTIALEAASTRQPEMQHWFRPVGRAVSFWIATVIRRAGLRPSLFIPHEITAARTEPSFLGRKKRPH